MSCTIVQVVVKHKSQNNVNGQIPTTHSVKTFESICDCKAILKRLLLPTALCKLSKLHYIHHN